MRASVLPLLCVVLPLTACFDDPADQVAAPTVTGPPPVEVCTQARNALDSMRDKGAIDYQDDGSAVMEESLWAQMDDGKRDAIARTLAFHAACIAKAGSASQRIVIRNAFGNVMMQRNFDSRVNAMSLFGD